MNMNRLRAPRAILLATVATVALAALGLSAQACGGVGPDGPSSTAAGEKTATGAQDLTLIGFKLPEPTLTIGLNDASVTINPIGTIGELFPQITLPDPLKPINTIIGVVEDGGKVAVEVPGIAVSVGLPGLPIPQLPDPFDGGIPIITP